MVSAFEQSLSNMTSRLHDLTMTAEKKDSELSDLRRTIDLLRQSGADAGLISLTRHKSTDSVNSAVSESGTQFNRKSYGSSSGLKNRVEIPL